MTKETIDLIVDGGAASAGAALGQSLGPLRINIKDVISKINEKTSAFKGIKVPVKIIVDKDTKDFDVTVGSPAVSELIKNELKLEKGSGQPNLEKLGNMSIEQLIKVAKMKKDNMLVNSLKSAIKSVAGSCGQMGVLIESKEPKEIIQDINSGVYDSQIKSEKIEPSKEKLKELAENLKKIQEELKKKAEAKKAEEKPKEEVAVAAPAEGAKEVAPKEGETKPVAKEVKK